MNLTNHQLHCIQSFIDLMRVIVDCDGPNMKKDLKWQLYNLERVLDAYLNLTDEEL